LEDAFDRIAGTTLKFKDSWWDKGEEVWQSKMFHLIETVSLTSRNQIERSRMKKNSAEQRCSFVWNETIWKSFTDGFIKKNRHGDVSQDQQWSMARFDVRKLCIGTLGVSDFHRPSELISTRAQITAYNYWKQILNSFPMFARTWASISLRFPNDP